MPGLTQAKLKRLEDKESLAAALASLVSSLHLVRNHACSRVLTDDQSGQCQGRSFEKGGEEMRRRKMQPCSQCSEQIGARTSSRYLRAIQLSQWEPDWVSQELMPAREPKEAECLKQDPVQVGWLLDPHACTEACSHPWQRLGSVSMRPWSCFPWSWVQVMKNLT